MEEEEAILMVELNGLPNPDLIHQCKNLSLLGLDTAEPVLQLDNNVFRGSYEDVPGTVMVFTQDASGDTVSYLCKTSKKLYMTKVILQKNTTQQEEDPSQSDPELRTQ